MKLSGLKNISYYGLKKNIGQYGAIALGISKTSAKINIICDQDMTEIPEQDIYNLISNSDDFDLQYIYQKEESKNFIRTFYSTLWHTIISLNVNKSAQLKNPVPFRVISLNLINKLKDENYILSNLDIDLLKYADNWKFLESESKEQLSAKSKSQYSFVQLTKVGIYAVLSVILSFKKIVLFSAILISFIIFLSSKNVLFASIILGLLLSIIGISIFINREQSYDVQLRQISEWVKEVKW